MDMAVIKLTGLLFSEKYTKNLQAIANILQQLSETMKIFVVTGGGQRAREIIAYGKKLDLNKEQLDQLGIEISRLNAKILSYLLGDLANKTIPKTIEEAVSIEKPIIVLGGLQPGQSTDAVAALLAEYTNAKKLVIGKRVQGVYDKDPNKYKDAKLLKEISISELREILESKNIPGEYRLLDYLALEIIERAQVDTYIINALIPENIIEVLNGKNPGTKIII